MLNFGLRSDVNAASSSCLICGLSGAGVAPSLRIARKAITKSMLLGSKMAMRSPVTTPCPERYLANPEVKLSRSDQLSLWSSQTTAVFSGNRRALVSMVQTKLSCMPNAFGPWSDGVVECWGSEFLPSLHYSNTPSLQPKLFAENFFDADPLPNFTRDAVSRGKCSEGRFGGGIDAPLRSIAVF